MEFNSQHYIKVYHCFTEPKQELEHWKLSTNELYVYAYVNMFKTHGFKGVAFVSIDLLSQHVQLYRKGANNKKEIKRCLDVLHEKGVIDLSCSTYKSSDVLAVTFPQHEELDATGYQEVTADILQLADDAEPFYVLCVVTRWNNGKKCRASYNRWAQLLGCKKNHAVNLIESMVKSGKLIKETSGFIDASRQDYNTYYVGNGQALQEPPEQSEQQEQPETVEETDKAEDFEQEILTSLGATDDVELPPIPIPQPSTELSEPIAMAEPVEMDEDELWHSWRQMGDGDTLIEEASIPQMSEYEEDDLFAEYDRRFEERRKQKEAIAAISEDGLYRWQPKFV